MANIGGLSGATSASMYGANMKGYGGLASGLDTDSLIEGMTIGTRTKIQEAIKKQDKYQWQMDAYRSVSDPLVAFSNKYLNLTSPSSPYRSSFFDKSIVTVGGANSKHLSVSGVSGAMDNMNVLRIKQLAKDASMVTKKNSSVQSLNTGDVKFGEDVVISNLDGGRLAITYGNYTYGFDLQSGSEVIGAPDNIAKFSTADETVATINQIFKNTKLVDYPGENLLSKVKLETDNDKFILKRVEIDTTVSLSLSDLSSEATLKLMGFVDADGEMVDKGVITPPGMIGTANLSAQDYLSKAHKFEDYMEGKAMTFNYNGISKSIKFPSASEIKTQWLDGKTPDQGAAAMAQEMEKRLGEAFGSNKIAVTSSSASTGNPPEWKHSFSFKTEDSSILKMISADEGIIGKRGVLNMNPGSSNRLDMQVPLGESGLRGLEGLTPEFWKPRMTPDGKDFILDADGNKTYNPTGFNDASGKLLIGINGKSVSGLTVESSLRDIMMAINDADVGVKMSYIETADRFSLTSTNRGEAGKIEFGNPPTNGGPTDFLKTLFGDDSTVDYELMKGQDSIMTVVYEGNVEMDIVRDSNSYNLDGATFTLNSLFGIELDANGKPVLDSNGKPIDKTTEAITFKTSVDTEKVSKVIGEMIDDYNKVVERSNNLVSTKPDRKFSPLTDDEKSQLTADQIEKLEGKAKEGILFNDPLLRSLTDKLRSVFSGVTDIGTLKDIGINVSSNYLDNGKIDFDVEAFENALSENTEMVKDIFTKDSTASDHGGITVRLKSITDEFAKTTGVVKGSLIEKAGSTSAPTSILSNALKKAMDEIDVNVKALKKKLQVEIDRYTKQFTSLEQLISQMNSQSSWFNQPMG